MNGHRTLPNSACPSAFNILGVWGLHPWHMKIPRSGIKPASQQWPKLLQWWCQILDPLYHRGSSLFQLFNLLNCIYFLENYYPLYFMHKKTGSQIHLPWAEKKSHRQMRSAHHTTKGSPFLLPQLALSAHLIQSFQPQNVLEGMGD